MHFTTPRVCFVFADITDNISIHHDWLEQRKCWDVRRCCLQILIWFGGLTGGGGGGGGGVLRRATAACQQEDVCASYYWRRNWKDKSLLKRRANTFDFLGRAPQKLFHKKISFSERVVGKQQAASVWQCGSVNPTPPTPLTLGVRDRLNITTWLFDRSPQQLLEMTWDDMSQYTDILHCIVYRRCTVNTVVFRTTAFFKKNLRQWFTPCEKYFLINNKQLKSMKVEVKRQQNVISYWFSLNCKSLRSSRSGICQIKGVWNILKNIF